MRIGHGYDAHRFSDKLSPSDKQFIIIGGEKIPYQYSLLAHSDGDVLIHALCDAILGALALGDIGRHFPDTDNAFKNINSRNLLSTVMDKASDSGYKIANADMTIIAQTPKMSPYIESMQNKISSDCQCDNSQINIKATTTEKMGFTGRKEGISAHAVVLLQRI
jgi:2-C-methyl-D-erythritol 2,4-cyclodiphosphate synthase